MTACGGGSTPPTVVTRSPIGAALSLSSLTLTPAASTPPSVSVTVNRPGGDTDSVNITVSNLPSGVQATVTQPGTGNSGAIAFTIGTSIPAGSYTVSVQTADSATTANNTLTLVIPVVATISSSPDTSSGLNGDATLQEAMSTSFQPASWTIGTFATASSTKVSELNALGSQHIRLQPVEHGTPQTAPGSWDFSTLNALLDPVIQTTDKSPELQLARAPEYLYAQDGTLPVSQFAAYAQYAANMVKYYNTHAGFVDSNGVTHSHMADSPSAGFTPITYWGIYNEPNYNGVSASDYVTLYNMTVQAMLSAGSEVPIQFLAIEMGDGYSSQQQAYFTAFAQGVTGQVDVIATHYYATCNQADSDAQLFDAIPSTFVPELQFIRKTLKTNSSLADLPIWITENNVNADYDKGEGISACNGGPFTLDPRGTSAYFAAWRPYMFSQVGKLGVQGLYQWVFDGDKQYGEIDDSGNKYLSYWVDYYLHQYFEASTEWFSFTNTLVSVSTNESSNAPIVEILAVKRGDGSYVIMLANHAVANAGDNNGSGAAQTVVLDVSQLGSFLFTDQIMLDANTDVANGPTPATLTPGSQLTIHFGGYGTAFITLSNNPIAHIKPPAPQKVRAQSVIEVQQDCSDTDNCDDSNQ